MSKTFHREAIKGDLRTTEQLVSFWANDDAEKLAEGLKAALDETNSA